MQLVLVALHVLVCVALILIVLLQRGKGADMGAVFGGSSQAVFGSAGATSFLHKITTVAAVVFMLTSLGLSLLFGKGATSSVMEDVAPPEAPPAAEAPASPDAAKPEAPAQ